MLYSKLFKRLFDDLAGPGVACWHLPFRMLATIHVSRLEVLGINVHWKPSVSEGSCCVSRCPASLLITWDDSETCVPQYFFRLPRIL